MQQKKPLKLICNSVWTIILCTYCIYFLELYVCAATCYHDVGLKEQTHHIQLQIVATANSLYRLTKTVF